MRGTERRHIFVSARPWRSRVAVAVLAAVLVAAALDCLAPAALALPEGRVYEMVSPVYKGGYGANSIVAVAPDGESLVFDSLGAFAGAPSSPAFNPYIARRGATGWSTTSLILPATIAPATQLAGILDLSATLGSALFGGYPGPNGLRAKHEGAEEIFLLHQTSTPDIAEDFEVAGRVKPVGNAKEVRPYYAGSSTDLSHIVLIGEPNEPLSLEGVGTEGRQLYDLAAGGEGDSSPRFVALNDKGEPIDPHCSALLGASSAGPPNTKGSEFNAIAADGREIFFSVSTNPAAGKECDAPANPEAVFVRVDAQDTVQVSAPFPASCDPKAPCHESVPARAEFWGADESGTCAFFTTSQPLATGDTDAGPDLYMARVGRAGEEEGRGCEPAVTGQGAPQVTSLMQISHDSNPGQAADVQGVVAISPDGSHVYFVARGALGEGVNSEGLAPVAGADNLYVYERDEHYPSGHVAFVADLCSGAEASGEVRDAQCPANLGGKNSDVRLWSGSSSPEEQTAEEGRFLVFSSYGQLSANDTDTARDIYRYDAATGALNRVSIGEDGYDANGNNSMYDARLLEEELNKGQAADKARLGTRAISEDGSRIVFTSAEPLSAHALNGLVNAYEWHQAPGSSEGAVSLVSTGDATSEAVEDVVISPSGRDVFFETTQGLVAQDTDGLVDIYDARLEGGFPPPPAPEQQCAGDACQGSLSTPAPLLVPGSVSQAAGGNFSAAVSKPPVKKQAKPKKKKAKPKRKPKQRGKGKASRRRRPTGGRRG